MTRPPRATDADRITFTGKMLIGAITMTAMIIGSVYGLTGGIRESQLRSESDIRDLRTRIEYEAKLREADKETFTQAFKALEAKIDSASNRAAALSAMQELTKSQMQNKGR